MLRNKDFTIIETIVKFTSVQGIYGFLRTESRL